MAFSQAEGTQGNTLGEIPILSYFLHPQNFVNSSSTRFLNFGNQIQNVTTMQRDTNRLDKRQGETLEIIST